MTPWSPGHWRPDHWLKMGHCWTRHGDTEIDLTATCVIVTGDTALHRLSLTDTGHIGWWVVDWGALNYCQLLNIALSGVKRSILIRKLGKTNHKCLLVYFVLFLYSFDKRIKKSDKLCTLGKKFCRESFFNLSWL